MSQIPADCLSGIFEYLYGDKASLYSCLLVNRLWCKISVKILWRNSCTANFRTLISCFPNESKEILSKNGIIISPPTPKYPVFNYASFCKILPIDRVYHKLRLVLKKQQSISLQDLNGNSVIVTQEILKLFVKQIHSLKNLTIYIHQEFQ